MQSKGRAQFLPASAKIVSDWHGSEYAITALAKSPLKGSRGPLLSRRRFGWPRRARTAGRALTWPYSIAPDRPVGLHPVPPAGVRRLRQESGDYLLPPMHLYCTATTPFCSDFFLPSLLITGTEKAFLDVFAWFNLHMVSDSM